MLKALHAQEDAEAARLRHIAGTKWSTACYLNMKRLQERRQQEASEATKAVG
jgi:hypothetical protein